MLTLVAALGLAGVTAPRPAFLPGDRAVVVGVSEYRSETMTDLRFADSDARRFARLLVETVHVPAENVVLLVSRPKEGERLASSANVAQAVANAGDAWDGSAGHTLYFYYAGHGMEKGNRHFVTGSDYDRAAAATPGEEALATANLSRSLAEIRAGLVVAFYDMCRTSFSSRRNNEKEALPSGLGAERVATFFSASNGVSRESEATNGGEFTDAVIEGMSPVARPGTTLPIVGALTQGYVVTVGSLDRYLRLRFSARTSATKAGSAAREDDTLPASAPDRTEENLNLPVSRCDDARSARLAAYREGSVQASGQSDDPYLSLLSDALGYCARKEFDEAVAALRILTKKYPDRPYPYFVWGTLLVDRGARAEAERQFREAIRIDPASIPARRSLGGLLAARGDLEGAEGQYRAAAEADPKNVEMLNRLGTVLLRRGDSKGAETRFRAAIAAEPTSAESIANLGNALYNGGDLNGAEEQFRAALAVDPKYVRAIHNLGQVRARRDDPKGAETQFRAAIAADPGYVASRNRLGTLLQARGDLAGAEEQFRAAIRADSLAAESMFNLAQLLRGKKDFAGAEAQFRAAIQADGTYGLAYEEFGGMLWDRGDLAGAERQWREAVRVAPKVVPFRRNLAFMLHRRRNLKEAEVHYREIVAQEPNAGRNYADLARVLLAQRKRADALTYARKAQALGLKTHPVYRALGIQGG